jgi:hypothetical protein
MIMITTTTNNKQQTTNNNNNKWLMLWCACSTWITALSRELGSDNKVWFCSWRPGAVKKLTRSKPTRSKEATKKLETLRLQSTRLLISEIIAKRTYRQVTLILADVGVCRRDTRVERPQTLPQERNPDWQHAHCPPMSAVSGSAIHIG